MERDTIQTAVNSYRLQYDTGMKQLQEFQAQVENLQRQLLMIEGAIIAIDSLLNAEPLPAEPIAETPSET